MDNLDYRRQPCRPLVPKGDWIYARRNWTCIKQGCHMGKLFPLHEVMANGDTYFQRGLVFILSDLKRSDSVQLNDNHLC